ncbi:glutamate ABC transporter substrate-binding protein [Streptomyces sp. BA2]|uniref:glutamate ABC transporter substrate-binding protein n=1 Tax=Streptomyces sp. BA2 TaxID=436595 RepID=UPI001320BA8F|nr:glutamate ABC transporter substrate-binding protein [Streptomyces sp. BA2]MWA09079.1 transporter substrate-binding domain-containing protein [Streptomyces sp. BA2]
MRRSKGAAAFVALVLTGGAAGCGGSDGGKDGDRLTVAVRDDLPGIGLRGPDGVYRGFDIDVATYVAEQLGVPEDRITWKATVPAERENLLVRGDVDLVVASYSITDERKRKVSFAGPYFLAHQDLLVRADDTSIKDAGDLNSRKLCSVTGSTSAQNVKDELAPKADLQEFSSPTECLTGLENKVVDALTNDDAILAGFAAQRAHRGKFKLVGLRLSDERYGIGVAKSDSELRGKVNKALRKMVSDKSWDRAVRKHFGPARFDYEQAPKITETG